MAPQTSTLLLLAVICIGLVSAELPLDCCLSTTNKTFPRNRVTSYMIQHAGKGCDVSATVFTTKTGRKLCFPHPSESSWVQNIIAHLEKGRGTKARSTMAIWTDTKILLCIVFICCCCSDVMGQIPMDCCLDVKNVTIPKKIVKDYHHQIGGQGCSINAVIFVTRRDISLCVPANEAWVNKMIQHVDDLKIRCKAKNYKARFCRGLKPN
ncbi:uncharacterized protein LOC143013750 [Genypterus blacodes]|uniref:uncharacterized protein LOC143013750 n=1 Tax=Genypterus blacodes TaxID=154954 RepID=UPI003F75B352